MKNIMTSITRFGMSCQLWYRNSIRRCCWDVATYKWEIHNGRIEFISFVV